MTHVLYSKTSILRFSMVRRLHYWVRMEVGKTTLLKVILGQETVDGDVWISPSAKYWLFDTGSV